MKFLSLVASLQLVSALYLPPSFDFDMRNETCVSSCVRNGVNGAILQKAEKALQGSPGLRLDLKWLDDSLRGVKTDCETFCTKYAV